MSAGAVVAAEAGVSRVGAAVPDVSWAGAAVAWTGVPPVGAAVGASMAVGSASGSRNRSW